MASNRDRFTESTLAELEMQFPRVRAGLDVGFANTAVSRAFRQARGGVWMTVECCAAAREVDVRDGLDPKSVLTLGRGGELPFADHQFDVVLFSTALMMVSRAVVSTLVKEAHRVLLGGGCLIFTAGEARGKAGEGWTARAIYELLRDGFDVADLRRAPWWQFGLAGRRLTVCARMKSWRNRGVPIVGPAMPVSSAMLSPRMRSGVR